MLNCMHALVGTSACALLVASDGFSFFGPERSHPGSFSLAMLRLYAQDAVARVLSRCMFLFFLCLFVAHFPRNPCFKASLGQ